ncbi:HAD hydrolase-like protein [Streptomyces broussonetiae]|uniref:HAD hydrolase-like protein n=1 Tax=Streptomyces broussonetiae TaxID=2686304 RepID=A0A6I6N5E8_9ACTN|nr:HAD hydrolase-like protein [Streptomyces broussonetiae]QHA08063.1 HAD hydrolase-like protein [Streptomyces broussonetiae]
MDRVGLTVLDCTLRDGGYYTNWNFDTALVEEYLAACPGLGIDVVELGYVRLTKDGFGPYGQLPEGLTPNLRKALPEDHELRFAVMVDAADLVGPPPAEVGGLLREKLAPGSLPVELVRVAVRYDKAADVTDAVGSLREAGYGVCLNLMQIDLASADELSACLGAVVAMGPLEAVYMADSLGSLRPERTAELVELFRTGQDAPVGIHAHDNQGFALHNTVVAAQSGALWLDGTVYGMGRGAGNTRIEQLLPVLGEGPDRLQPLMELIVRHFHPLMDRYRWGPSGLYAIAGMRDIHPTYVQRIEETASLGAEEKLRAIGFLAQASSAGFSAALLDEALARASGERLADVLARYPVVVFDLDGVLVDSNELKVECVRAAFAGFPGNLVERFTDEFRRTFGRSRREHFVAFHRMSVEHGLASPDFEAFYDQHAGAYADQLARRYPEAPLCAHAAETVQGLAARDIPLYVATGTLGDEAVKVLDAGGLLGAFRAVLGGEEPKSRRLAEILRQAGADARDVVLVGDSRQDVLAADELGIDFLLVTRYGFFPPDQVLRDRPGRPARIVTDLRPNAPVRVLTGLDG